MTTVQIVVECRKEIESKGTCDLKEEPGPVVYTIRPDSMVGAFCWDTEKRRNTFRQQEGPPKHVKQGDSGIHFGTLIGPPGKRVLALSSAGLDGLGPEARHVADRTINRKGTVPSESSMAEGT